MTSRLKNALANSPQRLDGDTPLQAEKLRRLLAKSEEHGFNKAVGRQGLSIVNRTNVLYSRRA